jgi:hypothetical protein
MNAMIKVILLGILIGGLIGGVLGQYYQVNIAHGRSMSVKNVTQDCYGVLQTTQAINGHGDQVCFTDPAVDEAVCHICQTDYSGKADYICWGYNPASLISHIYKNQIIGKIVWEVCT